MFVLDAKTAIEKVNKLFDENKYEKALDIISNYEKIICERNFQLELLVLKSKILRFKFSIDKKRTLFVDSELIEELRNLNDPELFTKAIIEYSYQYWISGDLEKACQILEREKENLNIINNQETKGSFYNQVFK